ncbi:hypothetical protein [Arachidicoccus sp.]|uniref:hypothetical protein n=1 Tax=Arachidicoccus sp. TaxID=1872624 RepID=UPI003D1AE359
MQKGLLDLHNLIRWIILILLVINILKNYMDIKKPFAKIHKKLGLWLMICAHTTLLVGLILLGFQWVNLPSNINVMTNPAYRFIFVEHPVGMIIAIILITIGKGSAKKNISDIKKHKRSANLYLIALIIIMASIPWNAPMIPGM